MIALRGYVDSLFNPFDESDEGKERYNKKDYCVAVVYVEHLAEKGARKRVPEPNVRGGGRGLINIPIRDVNTQTSYSLWHNLGSQDSWFVECYFLKDGGNIATDKITIPIEKCTPKEAVGRTGTGECDSVDIDVNGLPRVTGTIVLTVNWVEDMIAGFAISGTNVTAVATTPWWDATNASEQTAIIMHEAGHWLGMVPNGNLDNSAITGVAHNPKLPDTTEYHYDNSKGHLGNHCHYGIPKGQARYDSDIDLANAKCIMYGVLNGALEFCEHCKTSLKKLDLSKEEENEEENI
jgi:hypothetical protein